MATEEDRLEKPVVRRLPRIALVAAALVVAGVAGVVARLGTEAGSELPVDEDASPPAPEPTRDPAPEPAEEPEGTPSPSATVRDAGGSWTPLSPAPLAPRTTAAVWTGEEIIVWGGQEDTMIRRPYFDDGAAYDPATDEWRPLPPSPLGSRGGHVAVWADGQLLVWGGQDRIRYHDDGAAYDPETDAWTDIPGAPISPRRDAAAGLAGGELVVAGGYDGAGPLMDAAAYDPDTRRWRPVADELPPGADHPPTQATTVDDRLAVLSPGAWPPERSPTIGLYDPRADRWDALGAPDFLSEGGGEQWITAADHALVAVGAQGPGGRIRMAVHDGEEWRTVASPTRSPGAPQQLVRPGAKVVTADGDHVYLLDDTAEPLRYDLTEDSWAALPAIEGAPTGAGQPVPVSYEVVPVGEGLAVWFGGLADLTTPSAEVAPAGIVVWRPGD